MGKIYIHQTALRVILTTGANLTDATCKIAYQKPNGEEGSWPAVIDDATKGIIYYDIASAQDLDMAGRWKFWAEVTFANGTWAVGESAVENIHKPGE